jgi:hypothetical protein
MKKWFQKFKYYIYAIAVGVTWFVVSYLTQSLPLSVLTLLIGVILLTRSISRGSN